MRIEIIDKKIIKDGQLLNTQTVGGTPCGVSPAETLGALLLAVVPNIQVWVLRETLLKVARGHARKEFMIVSCTPQSLEDTGKIILEWLRKNDGQTTTTYIVNLT